MLEVLVVEAVSVFPEPFGHDNRSNQYLYADASVLRDLF